MSPQDLTSFLPEYQYQTLDPRKSEIRLATILPDTRDGPIRLQISHAYLGDFCPEPTYQRLNLEHVRASLPGDWSAYETLEGRILFTQEGAQGHVSTSCAHPCPNYPSHYYENPKSTSEGTDFQYEALSYFWGSASRSESAIVESPSSGCAWLRIRSNLADALRHLRSADTPRTIWADALCINQDDLEERNTQVLRMGSIYRLARRVIIWLGLATGDSGLAISTLEHLGSQLEVIREGRVFPRPGCSQPRWFYAATKLPYKDEVWLSLYRLLSRSWFSRLWILQEAQLASETSIVKCGDDEVPWPLFRRAVICLNAKSNGPSNSLRSRLNFADESANILQDFTLDQLFNITCWRDAADPRDRIYGIMSIAPLSFASEVRPNYFDSVTDVYRQTFLTYTQQYKRLTLLKYCGKPDQSWPTWIPDWTYQLDARSDNWGFAASGVSMANISVSGDILQVEALYISTIKTVHGLKMESIYDGLKYLEEVGGVGTSSAEYSTGESLVDAYLRTFSFGTLDDRIPGRGGWKPTISQWKEYLSQGRQDADMCSEDDIYGRFNHRVVSIVNRRSVVVLQDGHIGLGPRGACAGDCVYIILGCELPLVLRPTRGGAFRVIGQCYVHGVMEGEALLGALPSPWVLRVEVDKDNKYRPRYVNPHTNSQTKDDPRLASVLMPPEWEKMEYTWTRDGPLNAVKYRNKITGEAINSDPRMLSEALNTRGIEIKTIRLM